jgi:hypothetical protein
VSRPLADMDRFYEILARLEAAGGQGLPLSTYSGRSGLPVRGVYFFREPGEFRSADASELRIVRVGTHAVSANAKSTLWKRLRSHLGTRAGGGNHRGSIFRLHVGAALLARENKRLESWGFGSAVSSELRKDAAAMADESAWERRVSEYIGAMSVLWVDVPDAPSSISMRAFIEKNAIGLLSNQLKPLEPASTAWLGHHSPRVEIQRSHLWNLNCVNHQYDPAFLDQLEAAAQRTVEAVQRGR